MGFLLEEPCVGRVTGINLWKLCVGKLNTSSFQVTEWQRFIQRFKDYKRFIHYGNPLSCITHLVFVALVLVSLVAFVMAMVALVALLVVAVVAVVVLVATVLFGVLVVVPLPSKHYIM